MFGAGEEELDTAYGKIRGLTQIVKIRDTRILELELNLSAITDLNTTLESLLAAHDKARDKDD